MLMVGQTGTTASPPVAGEKPVLIPVLDEYQKNTSRLLSIVLLKHGSRSASNLSSVCRLYLPEVEQQSAEN
jgi:hypothetical protein